MTKIMNFPSSKPHRYTLCLAPYGEPCSVGEVFGSLTVLGEVLPDPKTRKRRFGVRCSCGVTKIVIACNVLAGRTQSCGCSRRKRAQR